MNYTRIKLSKTNYSKLDNASIVKKPSLEELRIIYKKYCDHKKFKSCQPLFENEIRQNKIMGYYDRGRIIAFTILRKLDDLNIESFQFAWDYEDPKLRMGIASIKHECAWAKKNGYHYLYLGQDDRYKKQFNGFEILGKL